MSDESTASRLAHKIARLVEECGWNQEEFARLSGLSRVTVFGILQGPPRRLHNTTVAACARALGLAVHELRDLPLETLLARLQPNPRQEGARPAINPFEEATQPELLAWAQENPERVRDLTADEWDELLSLQGTGGPLTAQGVQHFVDQIERRRRLVEKVQTIANTDYVDLLEQYVELLYRKVQPYRDRR